MNKYLIILALETLLEQVNIEGSLKTNLEYKSIYNKRVKEIEEQINIMKKYKFDYNFPNPIDGSNDSILIYKNK
tara:strand:+ start:251 stop:472 length:222 start_codon:yes stop_codon:yes gene_type:complete